MTICKPLSRWDDAVSAYLTNRRALGRRYRREERMLNHVRAFLVSEGRVDLDRILFDRWRESFSGLSPNSRIVYERIVYNFCRYRRRREPECFLPDPDSFARRGPSPLPTLIEPEQIEQLLIHLAEVRPKRHERLRPRVLRMAIILLYTTGIRRGELIRLTLADVDAEQGVLFIRDSKFHKSRWVPVSASVRAELQQYLAQRRQMEIDNRDSAPLLVTWRGHAYTGRGLRASLRSVFTAAGFRGPDGRLPRIHDLRHHADNRIMPSHRQRLFLSLLLSPSYGSSRVFRRGIIRSSLRTDNRVRKEKIHAERVLQTERFPRMPTKQPAAGTPRCVCDLTGRGCLRGVDGAIEASLGR